MKNQLTKGTTMTDYYTLANNTLPEELANSIVFLAGRDDYVGLIRHLKDAHRNREYLGYNREINAVWRAVLGSGVKHMEITQDWADKNWWAYPDVEIAGYDSGIAQYVADYINEEQSRNPLGDIDQYLVMQAMSAYLGGAR
jgi:hypothetical protein